MRTRTLELTVGLFILVGILALLVLALRVSGLSISPGNDTYKIRYTARVEMAIDGNVNTLPSDSAASILTAGLLGEKYVGISVGGEDSMLKDGDRIVDTQSALVLEELIGRFLLSTVSKED